MRDKKMKGVLKAFLQMIAAMSQEVGTMSRAGEFTDCEECLMLVDEIRITYHDGLRNLALLEQRLQAAGLRPPPDVT